MNSTFSEFLFTKILHFLHDFYKKFLKIINIKIYIFTIYNKSSSLFKKKEIKFIHLKAKVFENIQNKIYNEHYNAQ